MAPELTYFHHRRPLDR